MSSRILKSGIPENSLLIGLILISFLLVCFLAIKIRTTNEDALRSHRQQQQIQLAGQIAQALESRFSLYAQSTRILRPFLTTHPHTERELSEMLSRGLHDHQFPCILALFVTDPSGTVVLSTDPDLRGARFRPASSGNHILGGNDQSWVVTSRGAGFSGTTSGRSSSVFIVTPLLHSTSPIRSGATSDQMDRLSNLIVHLNFPSLVEHSFREIAAEIEIPHMWIVDSESHLIYHGSHSDSIVDQGPRSLEDCTFCHPMMRRMDKSVDRSATEFEFSNDNRSKIVVASAAIEWGNLGWRIFVGSPAVASTGVGTVWFPYHLFIIGLLAVMFLAGMRLIRKNVQAKRRAETDALQQREHKKLTEKIIEANRHVQSLVENVHDIVWIFDRHGRFNYANQRARQFSDLFGKELRTGNFEALVYEPDLQKTRKAFKDVLSGQTLRLVVRLHARDASIRTVDVNATPYHDDGSIAGIICFGRDITQERDHEVTLRRRGELELRITRISTQLVNAGTEEIDTVIQGALRDIAEFVGADRAYLFMYSDDQHFISNTHEWCREGIKPQIESLRHVSSHVFPWFNAQILKNEVVAIGRLDDLPDDASAEKEGLAAQNITSLLGVPMKLRGVVTGFVGFDAVRETIAWNDEDVTVLRLVGDMFANVLDRLRRDQDLRMFERRCRALPKQFASRISTIALCT